jgi:hypothetical protein
MDSARPQFESRRSSPPSSSSGLLHLHRPLLLPIAISGFFFPVTENPGIVKPFLLLSRCEFLPFFNFIFWAPSAANYCHNGNHILFAVFSFRELTCVYFFCFFFFFVVVVVC